MTIRATIAEFNPFHNGHKYLVDKMKECGGAVIAVMSGNYVQRGDCAIYDKFTRAKMAVAGGIDLVVELPLIYSLSSAENFALGAAETLNALGIVEELWFGSEAGSIDTLKKAADALTEESAEFKAVLSKSLKEGNSFPRARQQALEAVLGEKANTLSFPNNILGVEYIKALRRTKSKIVPVTIKRTGAEHDSGMVKGNIASASYIREMIKKSEDVQKYVPEVSAAKPVFTDNFNEIGVYRLRTASKEELLAVTDCNEEIANRLLAAAKENTIDGIVAAAHSKNYTDSRLRRIIFNLIVNNKMHYTPPQYIKVLAFNEAGAEILRKAKNGAALPIASRGAAVKDRDIFQAELRGAAVYEQISGMSTGGEFTHNPAEF